MKVPKDILVDINDVYTLESGKLGMINILYSMTGQLFFHLEEAIRDVPEAYKLVCVALQNKPRLHAIGRDDLAECLYQSYINITWDSRSEIKLLMPMIEEYSDQELKEVLSVIPHQEPLVFIKRNASTRGEHLDTPNLVLSTKPGRNEIDVDFRSLTSVNFWLPDKNLTFRTSYKDKTSLKDIILCVGKNAVGNYSVVPFIQQMGKKCSFTLIKIR